MSEDVELLEEQKSQDDDQQRDPALDWFLTHCHLHKYPANRQKAYNTLCSINALKDK